MKIYVKPRIHVSLISMHSGGYRKNGGIGFSIEEPKGILEFSASKQFSFEDTREARLGGNEQDQLLSALRQTQALLGLDKRIAIKFSGGMQTHVGMGSGTALRLACLEALLLANGKPIHQDELTSLSKRGGASGIGIQTYFSGRFVFDLGVKNEGGVFAPSSIARASKKPLLLDTVDFPDWTVGLCVPNDIPSKTQVEEREFFEKSCPIQEKQSYETLFHCLYGAYASVRENDIRSFSRSIREIQRCEWKGLERNEYPEDLFNLEKILYDYGAMCVGMSSLGPMLYFLAEEGDYEYISSQMKDANCKIILTKGANSGREIIF